MERLVEKAAAAVYEGDTDKAVVAARMTIEHGLDPVQFIDRGLVPGMLEIIDLFAQEKTALPTVLMAVTAMNNALKILDPSLTGQSTETVIFGKKGYFFAKRVLDRIEPLTQALHLMQPTRHTWPSLLWEVPDVIRKCFVEPEKTVF